MTHIIKKTLLILVIINVLIIFFLLKIKNKFIISNPIFGTVFNSIIKNDILCIKFNTKTDDIFEYSGKGVIFNIYDLSQPSYIDNINLINDVLNENINVNIVDVIFYDEENTQLVRDFIAKNNINRPVFYVSKKLLNRKLSINTNSVILSDFDINHVVRLKNIDYTELEENIKNLYKKTKKVRNHKNKKIIKNVNDELLIKSIGKLLILRNNDESELFFVDNIGKKVFSVYLNGKLNYYIGTGIDDDGALEKISFNNIKSIKFYKNNLYIADGIFIKKINLETNRVSIILQNDLLDEIIDFNIINENSFIFSTKSNKIIVYDEDFVVKKDNIGLINKIERYDNKLILLDTIHSKLYSYKNSNFKEYLNINKILKTDMKITDFSVSNGIFYFVADDNKILILKDNKVEVKDFKKIGNIKNMAVDKDILYISDGLNIYEINVKDLNNNNYENKIKNLDFKFSYKSKNYFAFKEFNFKDADTITVWKNDILSIVANTNDYIDYNAPNYIDLYEVNDKKISYISENSIMNNEVVFDKIDINKRYYINGKIYYRYKDNIFVKKINSFINFKDNHTNKNIEINFNNIYIYE